jgi:type II secretory pathway component PulJ
MPNLNHDSLMEERLHQAITRKRTQLAEAEEAVKNLRRDLSELTFIMGGTEKGGEDTVHRVQAKANKSKSKHGMSLVPWSEKENKIIIDFFKSKDGPVSAPLATKELLHKLHNRTEGSIRQRINRLSADGNLKRVVSKGSSTAAMMLEAA